MTSLNASFSPDNTPKASRVCAETGRTFEPGEKIYSLLLERDGKVERRDYCADAWRRLERPANAVAWWSSRVPTTVADKKEKIAPNDAALDLLESLADRPNDAAFRYALALLLARRRVLRFERDESESFAPLSTPPNVSAAERRTTVFYCPSRETSYVVPVVEPVGDEALAVQRRLVDALYGDESGANGVSPKSSAEPEAVVEPPLPDSKSR